MDINKRNRSELKQYFKINDKPTEQEFSDFIEASLNQAEDGIVKVQGDPLAIQAEGEEVGNLGVLNVFKSFSDENPEWSINLNPRTETEDLTSNQPGFNISDGTGQSKLFIKTGDGNVGVGTIEPTSKLTVVGKNTNSLLSAIDTTNEHATVFEVAQQGGKGMLLLRNNENSTETQLSADPQVPNFLQGKLGIGTKTPLTNLHVSGPNSELRISNSIPSSENSAVKLTLENVVKNQRWELSLNSLSNQLSFGVPNSGNNKILMNANGQMTIPRGITFGSLNVTSHINQDGALYRHSNNAYLTVKDNFFIKDTNINTVKLHFAPKSGRVAIGATGPQAPLSIKGTGKTINPDASMHITESSILFGGANRGNHQDSGQISVGKHVANSLNIVGVGTSSGNRKINLWAEGGMTIRGLTEIHGDVKVGGHVKIPATSVVAFSVAISINGLSGNREPVVFGHTNYNLGAHFKENQFFIAPVKGLYQFTMTIGKAGGSDRSVYWYLKLNNSSFVNGESGAELSERSILRARHDVNCFSRTINTVLNANDTIRVAQIGSGYPDNYASGFEGILLQALTD